MILTINNCDYSAALDAAIPLTIERALNAPTVCQFALMLPQDGSLAAPARFQPVSISGDDGVIYFTGYLAATPLPEYAGLALEGPRYRFAIRAVSDEILLDQALASAGRSASGLTGGALMAILVAHTGSALLNTSSLTLNTSISQFVSEPGAPFSKSAGQLAPQVRAAYRAQSGMLLLDSIPATVHALNETDGSLSLGNLTLTRNCKRDLANDITVCGEREPAAYVTEIFEGDGATNAFVLSADPYFPPAYATTIISELFNEPAIDTRAWGNPSGNTYFAIGAPGLTMHGGSGIDGQTQLAWLDLVEMGGTLLLEAQGVTLTNASTGLLAAFFSGAQTIASCVAGFHATAQQDTGAVALQPIVNGAPCGATFAVNPANRYNLRIRVHSPEQQRATATYLSCGDSGSIITGGQLVPAPAKLLFEIQETVDGVAGMPVTLYDGALAGIPATCIVVVASSLNLNGSIRALHLTSLGPAWVISTPANGTAFTRRLGSAAQSAECRVERTGRLVFNTGCTPAIGELITVSYRSIARAVGRQVNTASQQALAALGLPSTASWIGSVISPPARSSADCRNAAAAIAQAAASTAALWSGTYRTTNFDVAADIWPGGALDVNAPSCGINAQLIVRNVRLSYRATLPDLVEYQIAFANDWADDLAIRTSDSVPADAWLPAAIVPAHAASLNSLTVSVISGNTITVNAGTTAPAEGGFEIRTRDYAFMPGEDPSLVMRGSQPNLTFTRASATDRYYVRMFDGADPPNYSEFSAALLLNLPLTR
jgi:hypothetical protein